MQGPAYLEEELIKKCNQDLILSGKITIFTMLLPIVVAIIRWKKLNKPLKFFFAYCLATFLINCLELSYLEAVNNYTEFFIPWLEVTNYSLNFFLILYQLKGLLFLGYFFSLLFDAYGYRKIVWNASLILSLIAICTYILEQGWKNFGSYGATIDAIYISILPLSYLWFLTRATYEIPLMKNPYFLISLGLVIPNLIGLFLNFFGTSLQANHFCLFARFAITKNCFEILGQSLLALGFWRASYARFIKISSE